MSFLRERKTRDLCSFLERAEQRRERPRHWRELFPRLRAEVRESQKKARRCRSVVVKSKTRTLRKRSFLPLQLIRFLCNALFMSKKKSTSNYVNFRADFKHFVPRNFCPGQKLHLHAYCLLNCFLLRRAYSRTAIKRGIPRFIHCVIIAALTLLITYSLLRHLL